MNSFLIGRQTVEAAEPFTKAEVIKYCGT